MRIGSHNARCRYECQILNRNKIISLLLHLTFMHYGLYRGLIKRTVISRRRRHSFQGHYPQRQLLGDGAIQRSSSEASCFSFRNSVDSGLFSVPFDDFPSVDLDFTIRNLGFFTVLNNTLSTKLSTSASLSGRA